VAATNRDLELESRQGRLRPDLYFRLNGVSLVIPPLRERQGEIAGLATSFLSAVCRDMERPCPPAISPAVFGLLRQHPWPGNVRELRNVMERAAVMCTETTILPEHLPPSLVAALRMGQPKVSSPHREPNDQPPSLRAEMKSLEHRRILEAIEDCRGNQSEAARRLGMPRRTLVSRLAELGVTRQPPVGKA
jgi:DNA-binding NtrC family response regulator